MQSGSRSADAVVVSSRIVSDFLQLAQIPLLACVSDETDTVDPRLLAIPMTRFNKYHQTVDILELDESQGNVGSAVRVPVLLAELDHLGWGLALGIVEAEVVRSVRE